MAKISSITNKSTVTGTKAADVLTVKHSRVTVNAGKGKDKITVSSGSKHRIYSEAGNDIITVKARTGSGSKIYGDDEKGKVKGKDKFNINSGKRNYFYGGKGADTFTINGGSGNKIYGGAGNDVLTGGAGNDTFVYTGGDDIVTDYTARQDILQVSGGSIRGMAVTNNNNKVQMIILI